MQAKSYVGSQRDALYEQVRNHLAGLGDVVVALECQKDYATAERMAIEFGEDFRLMADLGWQPPGRPRHGQADDAAA